MQVRLRYTKKEKYTTSGFFPLMNKQISVREKRKKSGCFFQNFVLVYRHFLPVR